MRIRQVSTNCSFTISFDEFEDKILDSAYNVFFDEDYYGFVLCTMAGECVERYDINYEEKGERSSFIEFLEELGF